MRRRRYDAQQWMDWIDEQRESGLTVTEFCSQKQVSEGVFYSWRRKLAGEAAVDPFVPVAVTGAAAVEIELPGGVIMRVPNDAVSLQPIVKVLLEIGTP